MRCSGHISDKAAQKRGHEKIMWQSLLWGKTIKTPASEANVGAMCVSLRIKAPATTQCGDFGPRCPHFHMNMCGFTFLPRLSSENLFVSNLSHVISSDQVEGRQWKRPNGCVTSLLGGMGDLTPVKLELSQDYNTGQPFFRVNHIALAWKWKWREGNVLLKLLISEEQCIIYIFLTSFQKASQVQSSWQRTWAHERLQKFFFFVFVSQFCSLTS